VRRNGFASWMWFKPMSLDRGFRRRSAVDRRSLRAVLWVGLLVDALMALCRAQVLEMSSDGMPWVCLDFCTNGPHVQSKCLVCSVVVSLQATQLNEPGRCGNV
jgi:hypothetical protein